MNADDFSIVIGPSIAQWFLRLVVYLPRSKRVQLLIFDILILAITCNSTLGLIACLYPEREYILWNEIKKYHLSQSVSCSCVH